MRRRTQLAKRSPAHACWANGKRGIRDNLPALRPTCPPGHHVLHALRSPTHTGRRFRFRGHRIGYARLAQATASAADGRGATLARPTGPWARTTGAGWEWSADGAE